MRRRKRKEIEIFFVDKIYFVFDLQNIVSNGDAAARLIRPTIRGAVH